VDIERRELMANDNIGRQNLWPVCKQVYRPITNIVGSLIASQLHFTGNDACLQDNAELISECIGTVPERQFEQDWEGLITGILLPEQKLFGIGACIGPYNVNFAVREALSAPDMYVNNIHPSDKLILGIFTGTDLELKTIKWIEYLVSKTIHQNIDCKVIRYDEMEEVIAVFIMVKR
jgi:hypothetical protein